MSSTPAYQVIFEAPVSGVSGSGSPGSVLVMVSGTLLPATSANRGTRRSAGVALTTYINNGVVSYQCFGIIDATTAGMGAGTASWVRCSTTGQLERCTPSGSDDVCGYVETDGTFHACFGLLTAGIVNGSGGGATLPINLAGGSGVVTGTLPVANGGTNRTALGTSLQVLRTNVGATDTEWATVSGGSSSAGTTSGQVQTGDGLGGFLAPSNVLAGSSFLSVGATPSGTGALRLASGGGLYARGAANTLDQGLIAVDGSDNLWIGSGPAAANPIQGVVILGTPSTFYVEVSGTPIITTNATQVAFAKPLVGDASPFALNGLTIKAMTGSTATLTSAEFATYGLKVTGIGTNVVKYPAATDAAAYTKYVWNAGAGTLAVQDTNSVAAAATLAAGTGAVFQFSSSAVKQLTAAFTVA